MDINKVAFMIVSYFTISGSNLQLSIIHINDFHARFEEATTSLTTCKSTDCVGGFSRIYAVVNKLFRERPNSIFLNAGDNFMGSPWYNFFTWNVTQYFLNMLPTDAITLGNHEFDDGIAGLLPFLKSMKAPFVVSNIDDTLEPSIQGLYKKSVVINRDGKKIGIVGVISTATKQVSHTGNLTFLDESLSVNVESQRLLDKEGVFTVIVLSHCGYEVEKEIARKAVPGISVIVGGHSHTLLYTGTPPNGKSEGEYPTIVKSLFNETVLVIQAGAHSKYLGNLSIEYDDSGRLKYWEGNPIYLNATVPQDPYINNLINSYKLKIQTIGNIYLGKTKVFLDHSTCGFSECNLGNLITDAMISYYADLAEEGEWTKAAVAIINSGAIRSSINIGEITHNDVINAMPFRDTVDYGKLQGKHIKTIIEAVAAPYFFRKIYFSTNLIQVSGIRVVLDLSKPEGSRVVSLKIRCHQCKMPTYEDIDLDKYYPIALPKYLVRGGDNHFVIPQNLMNHDVGPLATDVIIRYIRQQSPIIIGLDERIIVRNINMRN